MLLFIMNSTLVLDLKLHPKLSDIVVIITATYYRMSIGKKELQRKIRGKRLGRMNTSNCLISLLLLARPKGQLLAIKCRMAWEKWILRYILSRYCLSFLKNLILRELYYARM